MYEFVAAGMSRVFLGWHWTFSVTLSAIGIIAGVLVVVVNETAAVNTPTQRLCAAKERIAPPSPYEKWSPSTLRRTPSTS